MRLSILLTVWLISLVPAKSDELSDLKIQLAIAEVRAQRLESMLQTEQQLAAELPEVPDLTPEPPKFITRQVQKSREVLKPKYCRGRICGYYKAIEHYTETEQVPVTSRATSDADRYATPPDVVHRIMTELNPRREEVFLDVGSGDGRVVVEAARRFGCRAIGIEQDPQRIAIAKDLAESQGVSHLVTFIEGDFTKIAWPRADVGYSYLFPEDLAAIAGKLSQLRRVATFAHAVPGWSMVDRGDFYSWERPVAKSMANPTTGVWYGGRFYTKPPCNRSNCSMCNYIRSQLAAQGVSR